MHDIALPEHCIQFAFQRLMSMNIERQSLYGYMIAINYVDQ